MLPKGAHVETSFGTPRPAGVLDRSHGIRISVFDADRSPASGGLTAFRAAFDDCGLVLWRGFGAAELAAFEELTRAFCTHFHGVGAREKLRQPGGDGFTSEVFRDNFTLLGHAEGNYRPYPRPGSGGAPSRPPDACFFLCQVPVSRPGGETSLTDGVEFLEEMPAALRRRFEDEGVVYEMSWDPERWRAEFPVRTVAELRSLLERHPGVEYRLDGEALHLSYRTAAITTARCGRAAFATGVLAHLSRVTHPRYQDCRVYAKASNHVRFGSGEELPAAVVDGLIDIHDRISYLHRWVAGELLLIDNTRFMHGRRMTAGTCDRVMLSRFGWLTGG